MRLCTVRPAEHDLDVELLVLVVLIAVGTGGLAWLLLAIPTPHCLLREVTGVPCLTCGGTRCVRSLLAGHYSLAFGWNPLVFLAILGAAVYAIYAAVVTALRLPRIRLTITTREAWFLRIVVVLIAAANWIYLIHRLSRGA